MSAVRAVSASRRSLLVTAAAFGLCLAFLTLARADGFLIPEPTPIGTGDAFSVTYHHVTVTVDGQIAKTEIDQVFRNETSRQLEADYLFPIPVGAQVSEFIMYDGKNRLTGELLDREQAVRVYEEIVRQRRDPGLLEYVGRDTIRARVFPLPPGGEKRFQVSYLQMVPRDGDLCKYLYPLSTERFSARPLADLTINVTLRSAAPIQAVYSPSHDIVVERQSDRLVTVKFEAGQVKPTTDFALYYTLSPEKLALSVLGYREGGEDGYFLLLASPRADEEAPAAPKDVLFVLDRTGSMSGEKIEQAKAALTFCLNSLSAGDRFDVIAFNESARTFADELQPATPGSIKRAVGFVRDLKATGGTNIDEALQTAFSMLGDGSRPRYIVFLTDGLPTVGQTNVETILQHAKQRNEGRARLFVFGVGHDVNVPFLDRLSEQNAGLSEYVRPSESIEAKVSALYQKVASPVLTQLSLAWDGARTMDIYPGQGSLPDLFRGSQLVVVGRYSQPGPATVRLIGKDGTGKTRTFALKVNLPESNREHDFLPALWAARKIGYLLDQVRLHRDQEVIEEIIRLSKDYGIMTEFTAFLVTEPEARTLSTSEQLRRAEYGFARAESEEAGSWAISQSQNASRLRLQEAPNAMQSRVAAAPGAPSLAGGVQGNQGYFDAEGRAQELRGVQNVGARTFYQEGRRWVDNRRTSGQNVVRIQQFSRAHLQLAAASSELARYLALGEVTVVLNGNAVEIGTEGKTELTAAELTDLVGSPSKPGRIGSARLSPVSHPVNGGAGPAAWLVVALGTITAALVRRRYA
jgi:Ca-activated chloride channel family protein